MNTRHRKHLGNNSRSLSIKESGLKKSLRECISILRKMDRDKTINHEEGEGVIKTLQDLVRENLRVESNEGDDIPIEDEVEDIEIKEAVKDCLSGDRILSRNIDLGGGHFINSLEFNKIRDKGIEFLKISREYDFIPSCQNCRHEYSIDCGINDRVSKYEAERLSFEKSFYYFLDDKGDVKFIMSRAEQNHLFDIGHRLKEETDDSGMSYCCTDWEWEKKYDR